jgi:hypothetical protein
MDITRTAAYSGRPYTLYVRWWTHTNDAANNRSRYNWSAWARSNSGYGSYALSSSGWAVRTGGEVPGGSIGSFDFRPDFTGKTIALGSGVSGWLGHDGNGNLGLLTGAYHNAPGPFNTASIGDSWVSGDRLPKVPGKTPTPTVSGISSTGMSVAWGAASRGHADIVEYQLQRATNVGFSGAVTASTGTARSAAVTGLTPGTDYWFRARARNGDGWGEWSDARATRTLSGAYVGKAGAFPSAEVRLGKAGALVLSDAVLVGKGGSFVNAG